MILIVKKFTVDFLSQDLKPLKSYRVNTVIDKHIEHINCCTTDYGDGFLMSCVLNQTSADPKAYGSEFIG